MAEWKLIERIVERSIADNWEDAVKEWEVHKMYLGHGECACGKTNIKRICIIQNEGTKLAIKVGSSCVTKFMNIPTQTVFNNIMKLDIDNTFLVKQCTIQLAFKLKKINQWELDFYLSAYDYKNKSPKQQAIIVRINTKLSTLIKRMEKVNGTI